MPSKGRMLTSAVDTGYNLLIKCRFTELICKYFKEKLKISAQPVSILSVWVVRRGGNKTISYAGDSRLVEDLEAEK